MRLVQAFKKNQKFCILFSITVFSLLINTTVFSIEKSNQNGLEYPLFLYDQGDYYRAITEFLRLKEKGSNDSEINLHLLRSHLKLKQYAQIEVLAGSILDHENQKQDIDLRKKAGFILSISYLETEHYGKAAETWQQFAEDGQFPTYNDSEEVDPQKAKLFSTLLPGSGMILTGDYKKAISSFLVNALFIAGSYQSFDQEQYGLASLLCFFEIGFYFGGRNASYESAVNYNNKIKRERFEPWKATQLEYIFR